MIKQTRIETIEDAQALFERFNKNGGDFYLVDDPPDDLPQFLTLADSFDVVRFARHAGDTGADFWVLWREAGYESEFQVHLLKVVETWILVQVGAEDILFLREDNGRVSRIEPTEQLAQRRAWNAFKRERAEQFADAEATTRERAIADANDWATASSV